MNMSTQRWTNPWGECDNFIDLGQYDVGRGHGGVDRYDLYALPYHGEQKHTIDFGARYGPAGEHYLSGAAYWDNNRQEWDIMGGQEILMAAARYFANHHQKVTQNDKG